MSYNPAPLRTAVKKQSSSEDSPERIPPVEMAAPVGFETLEEWFHQLPLDDDGRPTSELAQAVVRFFFNHPDETFRVSELCDEFHVPAPLMRLMCRQLQHMFILLNITSELPDEDAFGIYHGGRNARFRRCVRNWVFESAPRDSRFEHPCASFIPESPQEKDFPRYPAEPTRRSERLS